MPFLETGAGGVEFFRVISPEKESKLFFQEMRQKNQKERASAHTILKKLIA